MPQAAAALHSKPPAIAPPYAHRFCKYSRMCGGCAGHFHPLIARRRNPRSMLCGEPYWTMGTVWRGTLSTHKTTVCVIAGIGYTWPPTPQVLWTLTRFKVCGSQRLMTFAWRLGHCHYPVWSIVQHHVLQFMSAAMPCSLQGWPPNACRKVVVSPSSRSTILCAEVLSSV